MSYTSFVEKHQQQQKLKIDTISLDLFSYLFIHNHYNILRRIKEKNLKPINQYQTGVGETLEEAAIIFKFGVVVVEEGAIAVEGGAEVVKR